MFRDSYDVIVIGGGHAGCEAALASSRMGCSVLMLNLNVDNTAMMPCNPSIGGPAKGHLVREVSALGGEQARAADASTLMVRWLNTSKGVAVRALRAQCDPVKYSTYYRKLLTSQKNLDVSQDEAIDILTEKNRVIGILTRHDATYRARAIVLCGGVYIGGRVFVGSCSFKSGPMGQNSAERLLGSIERLGIRTGRMRTDTTPRLNIHTINLESATPQLSENEPLCFDIWGEKKVFKTPGYACWFSRTTEKTYEILSRNIERSPLVTGDLSSHGPRYCPSIEDKFLRFPDHITHPIVFEPVSPDNDEVYVQNFSTSLPYDVQVEMVHSLPGCENAKIIKPGYGIEYAYLSPEQLTSSLENKDIAGFFCAGQINGTSGYEEAAAQGLFAGINAALSVKGKDPLTLRRSEGYLGVLVDDLTTKSTDEPYRMLTSRCEHRLLMRWDNAAHRLSRYGREVGLIDDAKWEKLESSFESENAEIEVLKKTRLVPSEEARTLCLKFSKQNEQDEQKTEVLSEVMSAAEFMRHRGVTYRLAKSLVNLSNPASLSGFLSGDEAAHVEAELRYAGYIERDEQKFVRNEQKQEQKIPLDFDYDSVKGLSAESREKLKRFRPQSVGQALHISGVTPTDVRLISVIVSRQTKAKRKPS